MVKESPFPEVAIPECSLTENILQNIRNYGNDVALVDNTRGISLTFSEVGDHIRNLTASLYERGLRKRDVVAICASNRVEYPVVLLATAACGAIATTCNPQYHEAELLHQFKISKPRVIFCDAEVFQRLEIVADDLPSLMQVYTFEEVAGCISYSSLVKDGEDKDYPKTQIYPKEDLCLVPYSSGTTGLPKGVMLTHYNLMAQIVLSKIPMFMNRSSCFYMVVPMFHTFGFTMTLYCLQQGVKNCFDSRFDEEKLLQAVEKERVTHFSAVPPIMIQLAESTLAEKYDTTSLRRMMSGAAPTAPQLITTISEKFNIVVSPSYGMTEIVPLAIADPLLKTLTSVGTIAPNTTIKVIDVDTGIELGTGEDGEILAKGPQMMQGYLNNPDATAQTIDADGWLHTGDIGHYDKDGMLYVVDRLKELIKYKAFQVPPAELEATLLNHPEIADAAVIGIPDPLAGEVPKAFVVKKDPLLTENDVKAFIERELANYKHLRGGVQFLDVIPKSASGKILRKELRKLPTAMKSRL